MTTNCPNDNARVNPLAGDGDLGGFNTSGLAVYDAASLDRATRLTQDLRWLGSQTKLDLEHATTIRLLDDLDFFAGQAIDEDLVSAFWLICWKAGRLDAALKIALRLVGARIREAIAEYKASLVTPQAVMPV